MSEQWREEVREEGNDRVTGEPSVNLNEILEYLN